MQPIQWFDPESSTFTYLLIDEATRDAVLIDPVDTQLERDLAGLKAHNVRLRWVLETHAHADHITSAGQLIEHTGARRRRHPLAVAFSPLHDNCTMAT